MESSPEPFYNTVSAVDPTSSYLGDKAGFEVSGSGVLMATLYLAVFVAGLGGNSLVIISILKLDGMSTATTVYILNLALADCLFMLGLPFLAFQNLCGYWAFGDLMCRLVMVLDGVNQFTSIFCLTVMSVDRCLAAVDPLRFSRWRTPKWAKVVSLCLWLLSLLPVLPVALHFSSESGLCAADSGASLDWWLIFLTYTFALGFALPFAVMIASYAVLVVMLKSCQGHPRSPEGRRLERQATGMVAAVALAFAVCWLPFYALNFCALHHHDLALDFARGFEFAVLLSYAWSCANPILYACFSDTFRGNFHTLLCPRSGSQESPCETEGVDLHDVNRGETNVV